MLRFLVTSLILILIVTVSEAGWLDETIGNALKNVGEKAVNETTDGAYEGAKKTLEDSVEKKDVDKDNNVSGTNSPQRDVSTEQSREEQKTEQDTEGISGEREVSAPAPEEKTTLESEKVERDVFYVPNKKGKWFLWHIEPDFATELPKKEHDLFVKKVQQIVGIFQEAKTLNPPIGATVDPHAGISYAPGDKRVRGYVFICVSPYMQVKGRRSVFAGIAPEFDIKINDIKGTYIYGEHNSGDTILIFYSSFT